MPVLHGTDAFNPTSTTNSTSPLTLSSQKQSNQSEVAPLKRVNCLIQVKIKVSQSLLSSF